MEKLEIPFGCEATNTLIADWAVTAKSSTDFLFLVLMKYVASLINNLSADILLKLT